MFRNCTGWFTQTETNRISFAILTTEKERASMWFEKEKNCTYIQTVHCFLTIRGSYLVTHSFIFQSRKVSKFFFALRGYKLRIDIIRFRIRFRIAVVFYHFNTLMNWNADAKKNYNQILRYNTMRNATYTDARGPIVATFFHHKTWYAHLHIANSHIISLIEFTLLSLARAINRRDI